MTSFNLHHYLALFPALRHSPSGNLRSSCDEQGDVLYINLRDSGQATDSELTDDYVILRYDGDDLIGITILHASRR